MQIFTLVGTLLKKKNTKKNTKTILPQNKNGNAIPSFTIKYR